MTNLKELSSALRLVIATTKKAEADIVTRAAKDVAFKSAQFTPKLNRDRELGKLKKNGLLPALAAAACNKKFGVKQWNRQQHKDEMAAILKRRGKGFGAVRAGWIPAIQKLGGSYRGAKLRPGGSAADGTAKKATVTSLISFIVNAVKTESFNGRIKGPAEIKPAVSALNQAVSAVARDRVAYAEKKLREATKAFA